MFKRKNLNVALAVSSVLLASSATVQAEQVSGTATVTVQNAFTLASTTAIDFGTLRVTSTGVAANTATPGFTSLSVDGTQTATNGVNGGDQVTISVIAPGTPGRIDVTGAAPFTNLTVELATGGDDVNVTGGNPGDGFAGINNVDLTTAGAAAADKFVMYVGATQTRIEGGVNNATPYDDSAPNLRTDATGAVGLSFGGDLKWNEASTISPADGAYTGNYQITVTY